MLRTCAAFLYAAAASVPAQASSYRLLYTFAGGGDGAGGADGAKPEADLLNVHGTLYGTTSAAGSSSCTNGCGTVFVLTP